MIDIPFRLEFGDTCAVKELEFAHEELFADPHRDPVLTDMMAYDLSNTIKMLNFRTRCICRDVRCQWWEGGRCRCDGRIMCRHLGFEIRQRLENPDEEPSVEEMGMAKTEIAPRDLSRKPNEFFISWKVRVANTVYMKAHAIHNIPEEGAVVYKYETWRDEASENREINFMRTMGDVRGLGHERYGDMTQTVGCFVCGKIFKDETMLNTHVDARRYRGDRDHMDARAVYPTELKFVRATPSDYQPPEPRPTPPEPDLHHSRTPDREVDRLDHVLRNSSESSDEWITRIRDQVQSLRQDIYDEASEETEEGYPEATGCGGCGDIFFTQRDYTHHAFDVHSYGFSETAAMQIE